ncbi:MAG: hypothetical protein ACKORY_08245, partial [Actinomycetota bacterium]
SGWTVTVRAPGGWSMRVNDTARRRAGVNPRQDPPVSVAAMSLDVLRRSGSTSSDIAATLTGGS